MEHGGSAVFSHGERVVSNWLLSGCIQLDLDKLAVRDLRQQDEIRVRHMCKLMRLSGDRHKILGEATAHKRMRGTLCQHGAGAERQPDYERLASREKHIRNAPLDVIGASNFDVFAHGKKHSSYIHCFQGCQLVSSSAWQLGSSVFSSTSCTSDLHSS